jgi:hypothetical protein
MMQGPLNVKNYRVIFSNNDQNTHNKGAGQGMMAFYEAVLHISALAY